MGVKSGCLGGDEDGIGEAVGRGEDEDNGTDGIEESSQGIVGSVGRE